VFIRGALPLHVERAVDLGSGLGFTTQLLAEISQAPNVVGYERSTQHLERARLRNPTLTFREVDVLESPYPDSALDVVYSRFLLTHLHCPERVIRISLEHLRSGGRLLLEETTDLVSPLPALQHYYAMVGEMQAHYGQQLTIGLQLSEIANAVGQGGVTARQTPIYLPAVTMSTLHAMNIATWKHDPFMLGAHGIDTLDQLETTLNAIAQSHDDLPPVICTMAQVVVERV
jgi:SAM-dependent methyltransferase